MYVGCDSGEQYNDQVLSRWDSTYVISSPNSFFSTNPFSHMSFTPRLFVRWVEKEGRGQWRDPTQSRKRKDNYCHGLVYGQSVTIISLRFWRTSPTPRASLKYFADTSATFVWRFTCPPTPRYVGRSLSTHTQRSIVTAYNLRTPLTRVTTSLLISFSQLTTVTYSHGESLVRQGADLAPELLGDHVHGEAHSVDEGEIYVSCFYVT